MAKDTIILLEQLRCVSLKNTESRTEPYIWPALIRIDDTTLQTNERIAIVGPLLGNARVVIKDSMRVGETAAIPGSVGILRTRFEDGLVTRRLVLVIAMLEMDETPRKAMEAGFKAFYSELRPAIVENLLALDSAERQNDEEAKDQIIKTIKKRIESRVRSAIEDGLSAYEKAKILAGVLNLDDALGSAFKTFRPVGPVATPNAARTLAALPDIGTIPDRENFEPGPFTLRFDASTKILGRVSSSAYEIKGQLQVRPVLVERCQGQVDAVNAAQAVVNGIEQEIKDLQAQLRGEGDEPPLPKDFLLEEIARLREEDLPAAVAALEEARRALQACRLPRPPVVRPDVVGGVLDNVLVEVSPGNGHDRPLGSTLAVGPPPSVADR